MTVYSDAGVNIDLGDEASKILYEASKLTWENRKGKFGEVLEFFGNFSGTRAVRVSGLPADALTNLGFDGIGSKVLIAQIMGMHDTVAYDLFAMVCDDAVVRGAEPVLLGSILDVNSLGKNGKSYIEFVKQLAVGYVKAAREAGVAVVNGEVAELGASVTGYGDFNYNWGAGVAWFARESRLLKGNEIKEGDSIIALRENGFRSNGLSLVIKVMENAHGSNWHNVLFETQIAHSSNTFGNLVLTPSRIYTKAVVEMFGGFLGEPKAEIHGVVHVTGGGIPGKLARALRPSGLGAYLDKLFYPPEIMKHVQSIGNVSDEEAYKTWNMGNGMLIITPTPNDVLSIASSYNIGAQVAGFVVRDPLIKIKSLGMQGGREYISFAL